MPKIVRSAKGELVDFDVILIKNQLAQAPQNIEVARRQEFIDSKESGKSLKKVIPPAVQAAPLVTKATPDDFENDNVPPVAAATETKLEPPAPVIDRKK